MSAPLTPAAVRAAMMVRVLGSCILMVALILDAFFGGRCFVAASVGRGKIAVMMLR
jgi:hypothetical protein